MRYRWPYSAIITLAGVAFGHSGSTRSYVSRIWSTHDGLPESRIRAITQTPDGYLWIGTSGGLARFDGVRFVTFGRFNTRTTAGEDVSALAVARDGSLWAGIDGGGLLHYREGRFRFFGPDDGLMNEFVRAVLEDRKGNVWAATNRGLFRSAGRKFERLDEPLHLPNIAFFAIYEARDGRIFAGGPSGVFFVDDGKLRRYVRWREQDETIFCIAESEDGSLWVGTNRGLKVIDGDSQAVQSVYTRSIVTSLSEDLEGNIRFGTMGDGLLFVPARKRSAVRSAASLPDHGVAAIFEDREQNIWVGTTDGLVRMSAPDVGVLTSLDGLADDNVTTVYHDRHGSLWLTTITGGIFRYSGGHMEPFHPAPWADGMRFRPILEDHAGAFWFGSDSQGVVRIANGEAERFTTSDGLRNNGIEALFEDHENNLWIGTTSGLSRWDGARIRNYYLEDGLSYGWIRTIVADQRGDMLVGTERGLNRFHKGRFVSDPAFALLSRDRIWSICPEGGNTLWIGTRGGGLIRVRDGMVSRITTRQGLPSNSIFQVIGDGAGRLWMSGPLGISSASSFELNAVADGRQLPIAVFAYGIGDGLESTQMNGGFQPSGSIGPGGEIWFASVKGAVHFSPYHYRNERNPPVRMESVLVDDQMVPATGEVVVGPGRRKVEFDFTACSLRAPERLTFRYKLDGFDGQWVAASRRRAADYHNLPPGRYRFRVIAVNGSLDGSASESAIDLVVRPYFYQTVWFYALGAVGAGACFGCVFLFRERQVRDRYNLRLAERTRIAREMHDTVVQGCVGVSTLVEAAVGCAGSDQAQMLECLDNARIHLRMTLDEARQALSDLRHDSFEHGLGGALSELAWTVNGEKGIPVRLEVEGLPVRLADSVNRALVLVAREAVRNAVGHADPAAVRMRLGFEPCSVRLEIHDNGCGFDPDRVGLAAFGHFGIPGMRERMEQICGSLEIASSPGTGTTVTARLPLGSMF